MLTFFDPTSVSLSPAERKEETSMFRYIATCMHLFGLCRYRRCFRDRTCLHDPRECVARYAPLAPQGARDFMRAMLDGRMKNLDFDRMKHGHEEEWRNSPTGARLSKTRARPGKVELARMFERSDEDAEEEERE